MLRSLSMQCRQIRSVVRLTPFDVSTPEGRSKERYRRVIMTALSSLGAKGVSMVTVLISVPLTLNYLGRERFGLWAALSTLIGFLALTDLGVGSALVNATARAMGRDDRGMAQRAVSSAFYVLLLQGLLLILAYSMLQSHVDWPGVFNVHTDTARVEIGNAIAILIAIMALQLPLATVQRVQEGFQEGFVNNFWQAAASCVGLAGLLIVVHFRLGLPWLVLAVAGAPILAALINSLVQFLVVRPWLRPSLRYFDRAVSSELIRSGFVFLALTFFTFWGIYSDNLVI